MNKYDASPLFGWTYWCKSPFWTNKYNCKSPFGMNRFDVRCFSGWTVYFSLWEKCKQFHCSVYIPSIHVCSTFFFLFFHFFYPFLTRLENDLDPPSPQVTTPKYWNHHIWDECRSYSDLQLVPCPGLMSVNYSHSYSKLQLILCPGLMSVNYSHSYRKLQLILCPGLMSVN